MLKSSIFAAFIVLLPVSLTACNEGPEKEITAPTVWQEHLPVVKDPLELKANVAETMYVPIYSHIYDEDNTRTTLLTGTLSVRNTDPDKSIVLKSVAYYSTDGKLINQLCTDPVKLGPMATAEIVVPRTNTKGGSGANFLVQWTATSEVSEPIAEAVMISTGSAQSISFVCRGTVVKRVVAPK
jgi:hypothetical protein